MLPKSKSPTTPDSPTRPPDEPSTPFIERVVGWSTRHRALAIGGWLALVVVSVLAGGLVPGPGAPSSDPGESGRARQVMDQQHAYDPVRENVLVQGRGRRPAPFATSTLQRRATRDLVAALRATRAVTHVRSPLGSGDRDQISADGRSGLVSFQIAGPDDLLDAHYQSVVRTVQHVAHRYPHVRLAESGDKTVSDVVDDSIASDFGRAEHTSLPVSIVILLLVFGSLVAAGIPILLTAGTVVVTFALLRIVDHWMPINSATHSMVLLIGVAVGIDYSLFYLRRAREERAAGRNVRDALRITARTSGRVVLVAGLTVIVCLCGLLFTGIAAFRGLAVGTILIVGTAVAGSVTVLPALLSTLGHWVDRARVPWLGRRRTRPRPSRTWSAVATAVSRRPLLWGVTVTLIMLVVAAPALGLRLQDAAVTDSLPRSLPQVDATLRMQQAFPGIATPERVVIWRDGGAASHDPAVRAAVDQLRAEVAGDDGGATVPVRVATVDKALVVRVPLPGSGTDPTSDRALRDLRERILPGTLGRVEGLHYATMGKTAFAHDFTRQLRVRTPLVVAFVLVVAFALTALVFRSFAIPAVSMLLNLLSVATTLGVVTWVFQQGHLSGVLGFTPYGGVVSWEPLFMFVLLFGLSLDYHIFILSRVRERRLSGAEPTAAIVDGVAASAGVVTSAAAIMTAVFLVLGTLTAIEYQMLGVGMAVAVILDATVVRGVLLPAALSLLGDRAWQLPRRSPRPTGFRLQRR